MSWHTMRCRTTCSAVSLWRGAAPGLALLPGLRTCSSPCRWRPSGTASRTTSPRSCISTTTSRAGSILAIGPCGTVCCVSTTSCSSFPARGGPRASASNATSIRSTRAPFSLRRFRSLQTDGRRPWSWPRPSFGRAMEQWSALGLPVPEAGYELTGRAGRVIAEAELAWPERQVAVLLPEQREWASAFEAEGWRVIHCGSDDLAAAVAAALNE